MEISGIVKRFSRQAAGSPRVPRVTDLDNLAVDITKPFKAELARAGVRNGVVVGNGATFKAPITAYPTTTATWLLFNGEDDGGKCLFIDTVSFFLASGTSAVGGTVIAAVTKSKQHNAGVLPGAYSGTVSGNLSGKAYGGKAVLANAWTIVGGTPLWVPIGVLGSGEAATATIGLGAFCKVEGGIMVPPQYGLALDLVSGVGTTALYGVAVTWDELEADRES